MAFFISSAIKHKFFAYFRRKKTRFCKLDITKMRIFAVRYILLVIAHDKRITYNKYIH
ncbi:hypothetical protein BACCOP_03670 [Phocaeicola coprocola DSM 17136]|uniref:Uncharacterized protein n=1 Tax=Phocaeicola coprocola DSM 17136 TaxID=470145 RepID=B3JP03_9BACT|nr:hypothetical protein BACCOP_03670 [Phocaeicola coprocola DSM 17136]